MEVEKLGRTTGYTKGQVVAELFGYSPVEYVVDIIRGRKLVWFKSMFMIQGNLNHPFSASGDSGSIVVHTDSAGKRWAVGQIVAGTPEGFSLVLSLDRVLANFKVALVAGHNT